MSGVPRQTLPSSGTAASMALNAFRLSVERSRVRELASDPRSVNSSSTSRRLSRGASLGRNISINAKVAAATSPRDSMSESAAVAALKGRHEGPPSARASSAAGVFSSRFSAMPAPFGVTEFMQSIINASPGCYADDDGSSDILERYNFFAHGKRFLFAPCSLGIFDEANKFRQFVVWIVTSKSFDQVVLLLIATNSVMLAIVDVCHVDADGNPASEGSLRNTMADYSNSTFTALFAFECLLKIVAMGLIGDRGAYLMDPWNWIDFTVVVVGLIAALPSIPATAGMRALLVLRPLRFFNAVPGIKKLVTALLKSIPELLTVVAFLSFLFFFYGVIGVQLWSGAMHSRCRMSPYPLALDPNLSLKELPAYQEQVVAAPELFRCLGENSLPLEAETDSWSHDSSPWKTPRVCFWPVSSDGPAELCNLNEVDERTCPIGQTCGSDYDRNGNFRFTHPDDQIRAKLDLGVTYDSNLDFGLLGFDHIGQTAIVLFICMPREGWTDVMYMLQDAGFTTSVAIYLVSFVLVSSYFMLNLALAVIWENFSDASLVEAEERKLQREIAASMPPSPVNKGKASSYPVDEELTSIVDVINFVLTQIFLLEALVKVFGLGFQRWAEDRYNLFDALVVVLGIVEAIVSPPQFLSGSVHAKSQSFAGLRSMRIFRLFKLARSWPSLQKLIRLIANAVSEVGNFSVFLLLFMYVYALLGMQIFGNRFRFDSNGIPLTSPAADMDSEIYVPRANFDSLLWSGVTVFQVLTGENWNNVLFDGWRSTGSVALLYFISLVIFGNFIVLNLFLAILLSHFEDAEEANQEANNTEAKEALRTKSRVTPMMISASSLTPDNTRTGTRRRIALALEDSATGSILRSQSNRDSQSSLTKVSGRLGQSHGKSPQSYHSRRMSKTELSLLPVETMLLKARTPQGRSLYIFGPYNPLRKFAWNIVSHPRFDSAILGFVIASTACVALDNPLSAPDSTFVVVVGYVDSVFAAIFVLEVVIKIIARGLCLHPTAYLRNGWNVMDFVITAVAIPGLQFFTSDNNSQQLKFISSLRIFRAQRPLRMIHRNPGLKLVVSSLVSAIPQMLNVGMVCLLLLLIFSIIAVNNLKGRLFACSGDVFDALTTAQQALITNPRAWENLLADEKLWFNETTAALYASASVLATASEDIHGVDGITSRMICGYLNASWERTIPQSFDNVLYALLTFYEISTTEGWVTLMLAGVDATDVDMQPIANYHESWTLFFIAFIFLGSFFFIQLFIGVVIENFNRMKETLDGTRLLSCSQREWLLINQAVLKLRPKRKIRSPRGAFRLYCFRLARSSMLETVTMGAIMLNTFIMGLTYFGEEDLYSRIIEYANVFFTLLFALEAGIKIAGLGHYYWKDSWNIFDFVVVVGSCFGMIYTGVGGDAVGSSAAMIRGVRVLRLVRLIQTAPSLRQLVNTLLFTLPSLINIGGFLLLVFFIYAAVGVQLFAKVKLGDLVTPFANFQSISVAMITLIRCATGERWNDLMHELAETDNCVDDPDYDPDIFTMLITYILLNIFIAVILEGFANEKDQANGVLLPQHYENFVATWSILDPEATGMIEWHLLPKLIQQLDEPLGYGCHDNEVSVKEVTAFIEFLDITVYNGNRVFFNDVVRRLGKFVLDIVNEAPVPDLPSTIAVSQKWRMLMKGGKMRKPERYQVKHLHASVLLHDAVRSLIFREELHARVQKFTELTKDVLGSHHKRDAPASRRNSFGLHSYAEEEVAH
ncbi:hypothetical protein PF002_g3305 [Phytophthora fragariae]|uniref:Ion transport domain-containing protein n=1 Tax=Phytophthora fragariae TaxID=53985 RepID=A0A6A4ACX2_9STRA|nr:hypothetical protein PF002_g3305 [Phytophthora fragariae]